MSGGVSASARARFFLIGIVAEKNSLVRLAMQEEFCLFAANVDVRNAHFARASDYRRRVRRRLRGGRQRAQRVYNARNAACEWRRANARAHARACCCCETATLMRASLTSSATTTRIINSRQSAATYVEGKRSRLSRRTSDRPPSNFVVYKQAHGCEGAKKKRDTRI